MIVLKNFGFYFYLKKYFKYSFFLRKKKSVLLFEILLVIIDTML